MASTTSQSAPVHGSGSSSWIEHTAPVPAELLAGSPGLAFDVGGSSIKIAFRCNQQEHCCHKPKRAGLGHIHLIQLDKASLQSHKEAVFTHLQSSADFTPGSIHCTGYEAHLLYDVIRAHFPEVATMEAHDEFDCASAGLVYVTSHSALKFSDWVFENDVVLENKQLDLMEPLFEKFKKEDVPLLPEYADDWDGCFPCHMLMLGSGTGNIKVHKTKCAEVISAVGNGSRSFEALGKLITGAKSGEELIQLADEGDNTEVDEFLSDIFAMPLPPVKIFSFGKLHESDMDPNPAALARSLLVNWIQNITNQCSMACRMSAVHDGKRDDASSDNVTSVFVMGGWSNYEVVRREMTKAFIQQSLVSKYQAHQTVVRPYFVRHPAFLGCIGALLCAQQPIPTRQLGFIFT